MIYLDQIVEQRKPPSLNTSCQGINKQALVLFKSLIFGLCKVLFSPLISPYRPLQRKVTVWRMSSLSSTGWSLGFATVYCVCLISCLSSVRRWTLFGCVLCHCPLGGPRSCFLVQRSWVPEPVIFTPLGTDWPPQTPVIFNFLFSTELMMRHGDEVEIRAPLYGDTHSSQKSRL